VTLKTDDVMMLKIQLCHNKNKHLTVCVQVEGQKGTIEFSPVLCKKQSPGFYISGKREASSKKSH